MAVRAGAWAAGKAVFGTLYRRISGGFPAKESFTAATAGCKGAARLIIRYKRRYKHSPRYQVQRKLYDITRADGFVGDKQAIVLSFKAWARQLFQEFVFKQDGDDFAVVIILF